MKKSIKLLIYTVTLVLLTSVTTFIITSAFYGVGSPGFNSNGLKISRAMSVIRNLYLGKVSENKMTDEAIKGIVASCNDPYTVYLADEDLNSFITATEGAYVGIGVQIGVNETDNTITVIAPIEGGPALEAGVVSGDKILKIDGKPYTGNKLDEAVAYMKGEEGVPVVLTLMRNGKTFDVEVVRRQITMKSVKSEMLENNIGYIRISLFDINTANEFETEFNSLEGVKSLIIDLRDNPGGVLDACVEICDMLLPETTIVYTSDKNGKDEYYKSDSDCIDIPMVLLVNGSSASASEIMTGALKDNEKCTVVGTQTYGKGLVQGMYKLDERSAIKVTISEYFTPNGIAINKKGITPDYIIELPENLQNTAVAEIDRANDIQLKKAIELLNK